MEKYSVVFECEFKGIKEAAETALEIKEKNMFAATVYNLLCAHAEKVMLVISDDIEYGGDLIEYGISRLEEMGYIEIGGECEDDDYKMLWIMK